MDAQDQRSEWKSHMARIEYLVKVADADLAAQYRRELNEQLMFLTRKNSKRGDSAVNSARADR